MALRNYEVIVQKARTAERRAIVEEEKVQNARKVVTRAVKVEYVTRKCAQKPRKLSPVENTVVKQLRTQITHFTRQRVVVTRKVRHLTKVLLTTPQTNKPVIQKQIRVLRRSVTTLTKRIHSIKTVINRVHTPVKEFKPRPLIQEETQVVNTVNKKVRTFTKKVTVI